MPMANDEFNALFSGIVAEIDQEMHAARLSFTPRPRGLHFRTDAAPAHLTSVSFVDGLQALAAVSRADQLQRAVVDLFSILHKACIARG